MIITSNPIFNFIKKTIAGEYFTFYWVGAALTLASTYLLSKSTAKAGNQAAAGQERGIAEQGRQFDVTQEQFLPYREAGARGLKQYESLIQENRQGNIPGQFRFGADEFSQYKDPGYEFRVDEGLRALDRRMAKRGKRGAGVRSRALMELGQNLGSQEFQAARGRALQDYSIDVSREQSQYQRSYLDPLARSGQLAQMGAGVTQDLASQRTSYAGNIAQSYGAIGRTQAATTLGIARTTAAGISAIGQAYSGGDPRMSQTYGMSDYGRYTDTGRGPVISRQDFRG